MNNLRNAAARSVGAFSLALTLMMPGGIDRGAYASSPPPKRATDLLEGGFTQLRRYQPDKAIACFVPLAIHAAGADFGNYANRKLAARYYALIGRAFVFDTNYPAAAQAFQTAHLLDPDNQFATFSLADAWSNISRDRDAAPLFQTMKELAGHDSVAARFYARFLLRQEAYLEAIRVLESAIKLDPGHNKTGDWRLHQILGNAYSRAGYTARAEKEYITAAQTADKYSASLLTAARFGWKQALKKQEEALRAASLAAPDDPQWRVSLGNCMKYQKGMKEARTYFEQALACRRLISRAYFSYGIFLIEQKKLDAAKACLNRMDKLLGWNEQTMLLHASLLNAEQNPEQAAHYYEALIDVHPNSTTGYTALADVMVRRHDLNQAQSVLTRCVKALPNSASAWRRLGDVYCWRPNPDWAQAERCYFKALSLMPPYSPDLNELARNEMSLAYSGIGTCFYLTGKRDEALKFAGQYNQAKFIPDLPWYLKVVEIRPGKVDVNKGQSKEQQLAQHVVLGDMLRQKHQMPQCIDEFRKAVEIDPDDVNVHCYLLEALSESGDWIAAAKEDLETSNKIVAKLPHEIGKAFSKQETKKAAQPNSNAAASTPRSEQSQLLHTQPPKLEPTVDQ